MKLHVFSESLFLFSKAILDATKGTWRHWLYCMHHKIVHRRCPYCFTELLDSYALSIMVKNAIIRECIFDRKSRLWQNCNKCQFLLRMTIASDSSIRIETQIAIWVLRRNFKSRQSKEERLRYVQKNIQKDDKNVRDNMCKTSLKMLDII